MHYVWISSQDGEGVLKDMLIGEEIGDGTEVPELSELWVFQPMQQTHWPVKQEVPILVTYCCLVDSPNFSGLQQQFFMTFPSSYGSRIWTRSSRVVCLCPGAQCLHWVLDVKKALMGLVVHAGCGILARVPTSGLSMWLGLPHMEVWCNLKTSIPREKGRSHSSVMAQIWNSHSITVPSLVVEVDTGLLLGLRGGMPYLSMEEASIAF